MRDFIIIFILIIAIFWGGLYTKKHLDDTANQISIRLEELRNEIITAKDTGERSKAINKINEVEEEWKKISDIWAVLVIHQEIDNIESALIKSKACIENGELEDALQEVETANFFVNHVKEREKVNLKNIF